MKYLIKKDIFCYTTITIDTHSKVFELFPNSLIRLLYCSIKTDDEDNHPGIKVIQYTIALINAIASSKKGRDYLLPKDSNQPFGDLMTGLLIKRLVQILKKETSDTLVRQYAVGVLQKFSLRNTAQIQLIELDMAERLINTIRTEYQTLGDYSLECSFAMLMNLSLRTKGKEKLEEMHAVLIPLLKGVLLSSGGQVVIYTIGILFSVIGSRVMREFIRQTNLKKLLAATREKLRNSLFTSIQQEGEEEDDISEDEKRQLLVQITYIVQKLDEREDVERIQEAEESRIGFTNSEEQESQSEEEIISGEKRPGTAQRGAREDDDEDELTDDEELDSVLRDSGVLIGNALLISEYAIPETKDKTPAASPVKMKEIEETKEVPKENTPPRDKSNTVFDYKRPTHHPKRQFDEFTENPERDIRVSYQDMMKDRLELENKLIASDKKTDLSHGRYSKKYQSVSYPLEKPQNNDYELVFKTRSKVIRTPQNPKEPESYEQDTFGKKKSKSKFGLPNRDEEVRASELSRRKPKTKSSLPEFSTDIKKSSKTNRGDASTKKLSASLKF